MIGHMYFPLLLQPTKSFPSALLSLLLVMAVHSSRTVSLSRSQNCGTPLQQSLKLTRLIHKESVELIRTYASQGALSELFCKSSSSEVPQPKISGLEPSERLLSVSSVLRSFLPHLRRVLEQQTDLQSPSSRLLTELSNVRNRSASLASVIGRLYQDLFPNLPAPEPPAGGPTQMPPPQNIFQQKVYGCVVLRRFKDFLLNVARELRTLKSRVCRTPPANTLLF
ncbi:IL-6 subfamily cytokine M17 isoform X2 [Gadus macrocephalus]|uniref:IL-6 subfamily cytokine M17 isoform X2 n=1 Tax=Gadus macrocephalus TaxID=80720 RepID=UPI0028CB8C18|nr:IL-6 subfamily cytokine M17 isoform X2 [Gadus macrocephalus]